MVKNIFLEIYVSQLRKTGLLVHLLSRVNCFGGNLVECLAKMKAMLGLCLYTKLG